MKELIFQLPGALVHHSGQGQTYLALPDNLSSHLSPVVLALHGSGRHASSYSQVPFYCRQRDLALENGCVFAAVSNGPDTFGLPRGLHNVLLLLDWLQQEYGVRSQAALWATSAGGLMMHRFLAEAPHHTALLLGTFPIFNPRTQPPISSLLAAFGVATQEELWEATAQLNPASRAPGLYSHRRLVIAHGTEDSCVPIAQSRELLRLVRQEGGNMELIETSGGHSTENFALYQTQHFGEALRGYALGASPLI